ncbi:MAG: MATE family efflux transporter [Lachnospiraceae bacterium]|nr:MATE family efflux transporter [Lachnospiraceae bacterium]MBQ9233843.1 MATE family efflux transporter [Lachnospiraceae bacterium]
MKELTKGYPAKVILLFAFPLMASFIFQQLYNMIDAKIVSAYVGTNAFAAIGATAVVSNTIIGFINGLTQGFAIPVANAFGAQNFRQIRRFVAGAIILTFSTAFILTLAGEILIKRILILLNTTDDIMPFAVSYVKIILAGIIFTAVYNFCANTLRAIGDSKTPLYCLIISVVLNIFLDLLFVKGFSWEIKGAAYATIISQAVSGFSCLFYMIYKYKEILPKRDDFTITGKEYTNLITTGLAMGLMSCIVNIGTIILQGAINGLGTAIVTAHTAARRLFDILTIFLYSIGIAMTTYVSQNMGAGEKKRIKQGIWQAHIIVTAITTVLLIICFTLGRFIVEWITSTDSPEIVDPAVMYMRISVLFFYALGPLFVMRCSLQGMGHKIMPIISSITEMIIKILSVIFLVPKFGYKGVAFTEPISWVVMAVILWTAYLIVVREITDIKSE